jgi:hypothetical protein
VCTRGVGRRVSAGSRWEGRCIRGLGRRVSGSARARHLELGAAVTPYPIPHGRGLLYAHGVHDTASLGDLRRQDLLLPAGNRADILLGRRAGRPLRGLALLVRLRVEPDRRTSASCSWARLWARIAHHQQVPDVVVIVPGAQQGRSSNCRALSCAAEERRPGYRRHGQAAVVASAALGRGVRRVRLTGADLGARGCSWSVDVTGQRTKSTVRTGVTTATDHRRGTALSGTCWTRRGAC